MVRRRGFTWMAALVLVLSLSVAPTARAADMGRPDAGALWTSIQSWAQELLADWLGWGAAPESPGPVSTYNASEDSESEPWTVPLDVGPGSTTTSDEGGSIDPDG